MSLVRRLRALLDTLTDPLPAPPPPFARPADRPYRLTSVGEFELCVRGTTEPVRVLLRDGELTLPTAATSASAATYVLALDPDAAESLAGALLHAVDCPDEEAP